MNKLLLLGAALLVIPATAVGDLDWISFTVTRHVNTPLTTNTVDDALDDVNDRLKYDNHDCTDDTPCSARFFRSGTIGTFGTPGDGRDVITTQAELTAVFNVMTHRVKVVDAVDYCAGGYNPSIIGCGLRNAFGYIVENGVGGAVYVHEFGHNVDLGHRDDCDHNIMNTFSIGTNNSLNATECARFGGSAYTALCGNVWDGFGGPLTVAGGPYWVTCNVTVPAGRTLTIQAGAEIQFDQGGRRITSVGNTNADGSTTRITIYSNNEVKNFPTATVDGELIIQSGGVLILD